MFEVIPAIDVHQGRLAAIGQDGPHPVDAFDGDPVHAAAAFAEAGARWLHVVDLDLAFDGEPRNLGVVETIASLGPAVQVAGGVRTPDEIRTICNWPPMPLPASLVPNSTVVFWVVQGFSTIALPT